MVDAHFGEQRLVGIFIDLQDDFGQMSGKRLGESVERGARDGLDLFGRWGMVEPPRHTESA